MSTPRLKSGLARLRHLGGRSKDVARPIEGRHLYYAGWIAGTLSFHGLDFEVVVDEFGNPTNAIKLMGGPEKVEFSILVPEPPEEWPAAPSMPKHFPSW